MYLFSISVIKFEQLGKLDFITKQVTFGSVVIFDTCVHCGINVTFGSVLCIKRGRQFYWHLKNPVC